jgi:predicted transposase YdaD
MPPAIAWQAAGYVLDPPVVQQIARLDMATILKNPFEEEIKEIGIQEGKRAGKLEGMQESILALLEDRLGPAPPEISQAVRMAKSDVALRRLLLWAAGCRTLNKASLNAG